MNWKGTNLISPFWIGVTVILSIVFTVLFFPLVQTRYGIFSALLLTIAGLVVIWVNYLLRAYIFSSWNERRRDGTNDRDTARDDIRT